MNYVLLADRVRCFKEDKEYVQTMCKNFEDFGKEMREECIKEPLQSETVRSPFYL